MTQRIDSATQLGFAISPDESWAAVCALGSVWRLDLVTDRPAVRLTDDAHDAQAPVVSPDGRWVYFQSFASGFWNIHVVAVAGGPVVAVTDESADMRDPALSPDGRTLLVAGELDGQSALYAYALDRCDAGPALPAERPRLLLAAAGQDAADSLTLPSYGPDGSVLVRVGRRRLDLLGLDGSLRTVLEVEEQDRVFGAALGYRGEVLAVVARGLDAMPVPTAVRTELVLDGKTLQLPALSGADIFPCAPQALAPETLGVGDGEELVPSAGLDVAFAADGALVLAVGSEVRRVPLRIDVELPASNAPAPREIRRSRPGCFTGLLDLAVLPDGGLVLRAGGGVWQVDAAGVAARLVPQDGRWRADLTVSPDGSRLLFSSDASGSMNLWERDLLTGLETQVTDRADGPHAGAFSPDRTLLAFFDVDQRLWCRRVATGEEWAVTEPLDEPGAVSWFPDGSVLAFAAHEALSVRGRHGVNAVRVVDPVTCAAQTFHVGPGASLSSRTGCGPVVSPAGDRVAVVVDGLPHVMAVDRDAAGGVHLGAAVQVGSETADWPVFDPSGEWLYVLHLGTVRRMSVGDWRTEEVGVSFPQPAEVAPRRSAVRASRLWDGLTDTYRGPVDVVIAGDRIEVVLDAGGYDGPDLVDSGDSAVIPGLFDAHAHVTLAGADVLGVRQGLQWLAYGVTGLRSMGESLYAALEQREAVDAGARLGPRLFVCGELLDGSQVVADNRVVRDLATLDRELDKHLALGVDVAKAYVRMPPVMHEHLIRRCREAGVTVAGHYLFPNVWFGQTSVEHFGSPSRQDLNALVSLTGRSYDDVTAALESGAVAVCPTLFSSRGLAAAGCAPGSWEDDPRTAALVPGWQRDHFAARLGPERVSATSLDGLARHSATLARVVAAGGSVLSGTDMPHELPGLGVHLNMRALVRAGVSPADALRTGSVEVARNLGVLDDLGTVAAGKLADFSVVRGDPLTHVEAAADTAFTVAAGRVFSRDELCAAAGIATEPSGAPA